MVEGEAGWADVGHEGGKPEDASGNLVELGLHGWVLSLSE
jgi:hypothetical protein